jgi:hypothetical protein
MIPVLIFVISVLALLQFFFSYCRSLLAAYQKWDLSDEARELTGITDHSAAGDEFVRLVQLVRLCPEPGDDAVEIRAVSGYYRLLGFLRRALGRLIPPAGDWLERERSGCSYFAAVALDRRIAFNRELLARESSDEY